MNQIRIKRTVCHILSGIWLHTVETAGREKAAAMSPKYEPPRMSEVRVYGFKYANTRFCGFECRDQVLAIRSNASE